VGFVFMYIKFNQFIKETNDTLECIRDISKIGNILKRRTIFLPRYLKTKLKENSVTFVVGGSEHTKCGRDGVPCQLEREGGGGEKENGKDVLLLLFFLFCFCYIVSYIFFYKFVAFVVVVVLYDIILLVSFWVFLLSPSL
jgi:hypothetical protein